MARRLNALERHVVAGQERKPVDESVASQVFSWAAKNIDGTPRYRPSADDDEEPAADSGAVSDVMGALADPKVKAAVQYQLNLQAREDDYAKRKAYLDKKIAEAKDEAERAHAERVAEIVGEIHERGYAIVQILEGERLERLRAGMEPLFEAMVRLDEEAQARGQKNRGGLGASRISNSQNVFAKTDAADDVATDPLLIDVMEGVLGPGVWLSCAHAKNPLPGTTAQAIHRDDGTPGRFKFPGDDPHPHRPIVCNTLLALDPFTAESGGTILAPGSHVWPSMKHKRPELDDLEYLEMPAGSIMIFDGQMYHAAGNNTSESSPRRTLCLNYTPDWLRPIDNHYLTVSRQRILDMPKRLAGHLGYMRSISALGGTENSQPREYLRVLMEEGEGTQPKLAPEEVASFGFHKGPDGEWSAD